MANINKKTEEILPSSEVLCNIWSGLRPQVFSIQYSVFRNQNTGNFSLRENYWRK